MANAGNGIEVTGGTAAGPNVITGNKVGDRGKGNGDHGILIQHDQGNGTADPVELEDNVVRANGGKGIFVAGVDATGHELQLAAASQRASGAAWLPASTPPGTNCSGTSAAARGTR